MRRTREKVSRFSPGFRLAPGERRSSRAPAAPPFASLVEALRATPGVKIESSRPVRKDKEVRARTVVPRPLNPQREARQNLRLSSMLPYMDELRAAMEMQLAADW